jgi:hypothetical protein
VDIVVIAGLDTAMHSASVKRDAIVSEWMPGSSPGLTKSENDGG